MTKDQREIQRKFRILGALKSSATWPRPAANLGSAAPASFVGAKPMLSVVRLA
jgi:hypothetical protein